MDGKLVLAEACRGCMGITAGVGYTCLIRSLACVWVLNRRLLPLAMNHQTVDESPQTRSGTYSAEATLPQPSSKETNGAIVDIEPAQMAPPVDNPEGTLRGWLTVFGGFLVLFGTFGVVQSFGVYQDIYTRKTLSQWSASEISWIGSVQGFFVFAVGFPAGRLFDKGYFYHCMRFGTLLYIFSMFMLSLVKPQHYYQNFLAQGVGMGIGMGLMFLPAITIVSHWFRARRSLAMGLVVSGSSLGGCLYPIMLNNIFRSSETVGFPWAVRSVAFLDLGVLIIANILMRTRLPPKRAGGHGAVMKEILTDLPYMTFVVGTFLLFWGVFVPFFYLQLYAAKHMVLPNITRYSITMMNAASLVGRIVPNHLADMYGLFNVLIPSAMVCGALVFALIGATNVAGVVIFALLYGFFSGGVIALATPAATKFVTHQDLSDVGIRVGLLSFVLAFALLTGSPIAGALLSHQNYKWPRPLIFAAVVMFAGSACHIVVWRIFVLRKGTKRV
ncbi:hypothetical protein AMATHDRAFT_65048 [Amanita thiersii Skay4041]|uniref:Major facilitator superfamily (MFS) profile domain-containing protein n=1 Tax=Amanita thiersii Skay4041 TaxID=703135 RepID=A0A2A9NJW1_9AGAR|nr:hypothetical protein AMATHDRAFT_65048 [Amanita thiersii Skay4041]